VRKREITLPTVEQLVADADAGRLDDRIDAYLPDALYKARRTGTDRRTSASSNGRANASVGQPTKPRQAPSGSLPGV
jgi:hypothetical protein